MPLACWLWRFYVEVHDDRISPVADDHCLANLIGAGIDLLMRHVRRDIDEISRLSFGA
jgi:hypothetical protein